MDLMSNEVFQFINYVKCLFFTVDTPSLSGGLPRVRSFKTLRHEFKMQDACDFITNGVEVRGRWGDGWWGR